MRTLPILLTFFITGLFGSLQAQDLTRTVVGSAGSYFSDINTGNLHWTVGEVAVDYSVNGVVLAQGFHQGYYDLVLTSIWEAPELAIDLTVYPNPTVGQLIVEGSWDQGDRVRISDLLGRPIIETELAPERMDFELSSYPPGTYLISFERNGRLLKTMQLIKQ
ncbi:MAG: T9SS type A sorting domain-containing protein [Bacteroidota bacterium]